MTDEFGKLKKSEIIGGILYWPFYLVLTSLVLTVIFTLLGVDVTAELGYYKLNVAFFAVNFLAIAVIFRHFLLEQLKTAAQRPGRMVLMAVVAVCIYFAGMVAVSRLMAVLEALDIEVVNGNNDAVMDMAGAHFWPMLLMTVVLAPITEECLCRGLIFGGLYSRSPFWAYALSMAVFSTIHVAGYAFSQPVLITVVCFLQYLPAGFALAFAYRKSNTIWSAILAHGAINLLSMLASRFIA